MTIAFEREPGSFYAWLSSTNLIELSEVGINIPPFWCTTLHLGQEGWKGKIAHNTPRGGETRAKIRFYKNDISQGISIKLPATFLRDKAEDYWDLLLKYEQFMDTSLPQKNWSITHRDYITEVIDYLKSLGDHKRRMVLEAAGLYKSEGSNLEDLNILCQNLRKELGDDWAPGEKPQAQIMQFPKLVTDENLEEFINELRVACK